MTVLLDPSGGAYISAVVFHAYRCTAVNWVATGMRNGWDGAVGDGGWGGEGWADIVMDGSCFFPIGKFFSHTLDPPLNLSSYKMQIPVLFCLMYAHVYTN